MTGSIPDSANAPLGSIALLRSSCYREPRKPPKHQASIRSKRKTPPPEGSGVLCIEHRMRRISVLCRPGSDLLSQGLSHSTIGAEEFNGRVRDGIGFRLLARATRPAKDRDETSCFLSGDLTFQITSNFTSHSRRSENGH